MEKPSLSIYSKSCTAHNAYEVNSGGPMKKLILRFCLPFIVALGACTANAATYSVGDVFASIGSGKVAQFDNDLNLIQVLDTGLSGAFTTGSAFDSAGNFYVTTFGSNVVAKFDTNGVLVNASFATCDAGSACESIVFDMAGNFYVGQAEGTRDILKFDSSGALIDRFDVATSGRGSDWIDLAADQSTLVYTSESSGVSTYDTAGDVQGAQFGTTTTSPNFALRLLGDGGALVAASGAIDRLDNTGSVIDTFDFGANDSWFALNLDPDGDSFWSGDFTTNILAQFDLATGAVIQSLDLDSIVGLMGISGIDLFGVSVFGEITEGGGGPPIGDVPLPGALIFLLTGLGGLGAASKRRQRA